MAELVTLKLKPSKEHSLLRFHPWVFSGAIQESDRKVANGELVKVVSSKNQFLGIGHYQDASIAVRIISFIDRPIDHDFWVSKIRQARHTRLLIGLPDSTTNMFRLVHGEGDGLTGLVIDCYGKTVVIQPHSEGMHLASEQIAAAVREVCSDFAQNIILKHPSGQSTQEATVVFGTTDGKIIANEWGIQYQLDLLHGQKTGFFVDQRENRKLLGKYSRGKTVLNTFCYNGGFSLCALKAQASKVVSVDVSKSAVTQTEQNLILNGFDPAEHPCVAIDTFDFFKQNQELFDVIVLDPPAFAKHLSARHNAIKGYQRLNAEAIRHIKPGGILFTFSCSQVVDKTLFYNAIVAAAIQVGRQVKVLERLTQPADHPVSIYHPEGEYLKGLVVEIS